MSTYGRIATLATCLLILTALTPAPAPAQAIGAGDGEVGFDVGFVNFDEEVSEDEGFRGSFRGGYHFTDFFQLEGQISRYDTEDVFDITLDTIFINAVLNFHPAETIVPYALVGIGRAELEAEDFFTSVSDDSGAIQAAIGSRFFFGNSNRLAARIELNYLQEETFDEESEHFSVNAGLTWRLGG